MPYYTEDYWGDTMDDLADDLGYGPEEEEYDESLNDPAKWLSLCESDQFAADELAADQDREQDEANRQETASDRAAWYDQDRF